MNNSPKIALITGATRGIGNAIAMTLAATAGIYVIGTATSAAGADAITAQFKQANLAGEGRVLDVCQKEMLESFLSTLSDEEKDPSILVNNAGITRDDLLLRMSEEDWCDVIDTNLSAVFRLTKACLRPMFRARWGRIINVGSVVASSGNAGQANYTAAKAGIIGFSKSLAQEIASRNITVNVVSPGFIETDMTNALPSVVTQEMFKRIPMKHFGKPQDIAAVVGFLASEGANYITGETIHVNGGLYMN